jgi:hypothetical protein
MSKSLTTPKLAGCSDSLNLPEALLQKGTSAAKSRSLAAILVYPTINDGLNVDGDGKSSF